jgi:hypothetical protein
VSGNPILESAKQVMPEAEPRQTAVVIIGAGRSGTSAITRGVQALGVELGNDLRPGRGKNPTGFFEDQALLALNQRLKRALGIRGDSVRLIEAHEWELPAVRALEREAIQTIRERFGRSALWGYKYGRTLRLLPFWHRVFAALDLDVRWVFALRNPLSVARSRATLDPRRGQQEKSDLEWLVNVVPYFRLLRDRPLVVVDYDRVMAAPLPELERIAARLGLAVGERARAAMRSYAEEFLVPGMRHSRFTLEDLEREPRVNALLRDAYRWLHGLANDEVAADAADLWSDWQRIEAALTALAPILGLIDRQEAELRRVELSPLGPLQAVPRLWRKLRNR